mgnify:CR=1 FL=1
MNHPAAAFSVTVLSLCAPMAQAQSVLQRVAEAIRQLPGRKFVFTNGSRRHAEATMSQLGIADLFDDVFDIIESEFVPKPARQPYERFLARHSIAPVRAAMFPKFPTLAAGNNSLAGFDFVVWGGVLARRGGADTDAAARSAGATRAP